MFIAELSKPFERQVQLGRNWTLEDFLAECAKDPTLVESTASRMHAALGEAVQTQTSTDPRLLRIFGDRVLKTYKSFEDFYGLETVIEQIALYYYLAAQGLETRKKILCLIGPTGTAKSMLARRLKARFGQTVMYVLAVKEKCGDKERFVTSPVFEHPFDLFDRDEHAALLGKYGIRKYRLGAGGPSPWAWEQLTKKLDGDITKFHVVEVPCSTGQQIGIARIEPQSDKELEVSMLIGERNEDGSYDYSGGLNRAGQGVLEFVEMFKAPSDVLRPLLTAMEEGFYSGNGGVGPIPFRGMVICHSNWAEWDEFKKNPKNKGLVDRTLLIEVPYCLRVSEEEKIYAQMIEESELFNKPRAPYTTKTLAELTILSRLRPAGGGQPTIGMMRVYDGEDPEKVGGGVKSLAKYREERGAAEGKDGISTRSAFQIISATCMADPDEIGMDPKLLLEEALKVIARDYDNSSTYRGIVTNQLLPRYLELLERDIRLAYAKSRGGDTPQARFDRYRALARAWYYDDEEVYKDPDSGTVWDREQINLALSATEKVMKIENPKDFREDLVKHCLKYQADHGGGLQVVVPLETHERMRELVEAQMLTEGTNFAQVIAFGDFKRDAKVVKAHATFLACMVKAGYSERQAERLVGWFMKEKKLSYFDPPIEDKK